MAYYNLREATLIIRYCETQDEILKVCDNLKENKKEFAIHDLEVLKAWIQIKYDELEPKKK